MEIELIELERMGANMVHCLLRDGHCVVAWNLTAAQTRDKRTIRRYKGSLLRCP